MCLVQCGKCVCFPELKPQIPILIAKVKEFGRVHNRDKTLMLGSVFLLAKEETRAFSVPHENTQHDCLQPWLMNRVRSLMC